MREFTAVTKRSLGQGEDLSFVAKLAEISAARGEHAKLLGDAQAIIERYKSFVDSDPMVEAIDKNPFHPISLRGTLDPVLATLSKTVETQGSSAGA